MKPESTCHNIVLWKDDDDDDDDHDDDNDDDHDDDDDSFWRTLFTEIATQEWRLCDLLQVFVWSLSPTHTNTMEFHTAVIFSLAFIQTVASECTSSHMCVYAQASLMDTQTHSVKKDEFYKSGYNAAK